MQRTQQALPKACSNSHLTSHEQGETTVQDAWPRGRRSLEGVLWKRSLPSISSVLRRWDRSLEHQQQLRRGGHHLSHAELVFLAGNAGGHQTHRRLEARDITAIGQLNDGIGKLAPQALICSRLLQHSIGRYRPITGGLLEGNGPLPRMRRCLHSRAGDDTTQQHHQKRDRDIAPGQFPGLEGSDVNWSAPPQTMAILGLGSA